MRKSILAFAAGFAVLAAGVLPAVAFGPKDLPMIEGPAFGPKDLPLIEGPAFGPREPQPVDGPGI